MRRLREAAEKAKIELSSSLSHLDQPCPPSPTLVFLDDS